MMQSKGKNHPQVGSKDKHKTSGNEKGRLEARKSYFRRNPTVSYTKIHTEAISEEIIATMAC
jgi:hypothetical protein